VDEPSEQNVPKVCEIIREEEEEEEKESGRQYDKKKVGGVMNLDSLVSQEALLNPVE